MWSQGKLVVTFGFLPRNSVAYSFDGKMYFRGSQKYLSLASSMIEHLNMAPHYGAAWLPHCHWCLFIWQWLMHHLLMRHVTAV